ncbi:sigma-70 family RNA polymerase sigma factor [bacterium]|nr:sigma-70 family RNA polymerase sigma factor [bacterium]
MQSSAETHEGRELARREAFLELLGTCRHALFRYARRALDDPGEADDTLQTAVLLAFRDFHAFREGTNFRAYAFTYVAHAVQNANRRRSPVTYGLDPPEQADDHSDVLEALENEAAYADLLAAPERLLASIEEPLACALRALPETERDALLLRSIGELKYAEIAVIRRVPLGTVMTRLHRARAKLRRALTDHAKECGFIRHETARKKGTSP